MINQVGSSNYVFSDFKQPQNGSYFIMPQQQDEQKKGVSGKKIALYAMGAGFGILALMKGVMSKSFAKVLDKWKISLENKLAKDSKLKDFYRSMLQKVDTFRGYLESINNFTTMKDVLVQRLMCGKNGNRPVTSKIHKGITKIFDKISRSTVNSSYASTNKKFAGLNEYMYELNERLLRENPGNSDVINNIRTRMGRVNTAFENGFGLNARNERLKQMDTAAEGLFENFWNLSVSDIKNFKSKEVWQSYIAETYLLPYKMKMANETALLRQAITHDINDSYKAAVKVFDNIQKFVNPSDRKTYAVLNELRANLANYKKLSGKEELLQRNKLNEKITENLRRLSSTFNSQDYTPEARNAISNYIREAEEIISHSSKGELQEILTLYKSILPRNEYLKLKKQVQSAVKSLDKSIETETVKYFDKSRDLKLGAAPTDIISILAAMGTVGWFLGKSKNKDERISASLKYGIPVIGGIATSLYCTAKLISGGKAFLFGLLSTWAINKVGVFADDVRKQYSFGISLENKKKEVKNAVESLKPQPDKV